MHVDFIVSLYLLKTLVCDECSASGYGLCFLALDAFKKLTLIRDVMLPHSF